MIHFRGGHLTKDLYGAVPEVLVGGGGALIQDTFTDANGTALNSHSPDIDTVGTGWATAKLRTTDTGGGGTIQSNQLQLAESNSGHVINAGQANIDFTVEWTPAVGVDNRNHVVIRYASDGNMWTLQLREPNADINLVEVTSDTVTTRDTAAFAWVETTTYTIRFTAVGNVLTGYINGTQYVQYTSAQHNTATKVGLMQSGGNSASRFDDLLVVAG